MARDPGTTSALARDAATIAAGLCLARLTAPSEDVARVGRWIVATIGERLDLPPVGVVADLGALLFGASLRAGTAVPGDDPALADAVRRYEDAVLGRLAADVRLASAGFAVARLPPERHAQAVAILVAGLLRRIDFDAGFEVQPGIVRELTGRRPEESIRRGFGVLRDDPEVRRRLTEGYAALARCARKARDLVGDADLFALENLTVLGDLGQRLAIAEVLGAQEAIAEAIPRRLPRRRRREGDVSSRLEDESEYPAGGFASVSTSGSLENVVTSELVFMDPPATRSDVDLFDMRYVEGELLYYTRDEAIFVRRRRLVVVALAPDLVRARVKDPDLPWQRIVLVLGVVMVLVKMLVDLLGEEALELQVVFLAERGAPTPLAEEQGLAELMLREWRDRGIATVTSGSWEEVAERVSTYARRGLVEVVLVAGAVEPSSPAFDPRVVRASFAPPAGSLESWSRAAAELLSTLL